MNSQERAFHDFAQFAAKLKGPHSLMAATIAEFAMKAKALSLVSPRENLPDDVFDGDFFDGDVAHGEFVQQRLADGESRGVTSVSCLLAVPTRQVIVQP